MQRTDQNIFLIGPMGSGKTTIGRLVAQELGLEFHDCDHDLEKTTGASVNLIFDVEGEAGFRERESHLLLELSKLNGVLVSTGGGVVTREENRKVLRSSGLVIWLKTSVSQQLERLTHDKSRPLLQTKDRAARLYKLADERNPLYEETADLVFRSPNRSSRAAAGALCEMILDHQQTERLGQSHAHR